MVRVDTEEAFEAEIVSSMLASGWLAGDQHSYRSDVALDTAQLFPFIGATQADVWNTVIGWAGDADAAQRQFVRLLAREIDEPGALDVLRYGVPISGKR